MIFISLKATRILLSIRSRCSKGSLVLILIFRRGAISLPRAEQEQPAPAVFEFGGVEELPATAMPAETVAFDTDSCLCIAGRRWSGNTVAIMLAVPRRSQQELMRVWPNSLKSFVSLKKATLFKKISRPITTWGRHTKRWTSWTRPFRSFKLSASLVKAADGTSRFLQCCNMLGHCFIQKGMPEAAVLWFKKGLSAPGHSEDEYQALRYELASAYEQLGDLKQAREFYTEVYGVDVSYREVAEKLSQLRQKQE